MDLFISYRRDGGNVWADLLNTKLSALGIKVFYDKHKIENENYERKIRRCLLNSPNYLLILSPGIFSKHMRSGTDWVISELKFALDNNKNIILVQVEGTDLEAEFGIDNEAVSRISKLNTLRYTNDSISKEEASIKDIVNRMVDNEGKPYRLGEHIISNSWYAHQEDKSIEDVLWIKADYDVCHVWDQSMLKRICDEPVMKSKDKISLFVLKAYDIDTYSLKYNFVNPSTGKKYIDSVYGTADKNDVKKANDIFGGGHFIEDVDNELLFREAQQVLASSGLDGFDIIDMTLIIKDVKNPEKMVRELSSLLNPDGGALFIRELDDDFVYAYPNEDMIAKMKELLTLDDGAGNRHTGKKIYTFLKHAGSDKVYIDDKIISTANIKARHQQRLCDTYFSYLKPELKALSLEKPEIYQEHYNWLLSNYNTLENLFCSSEFYFRAGYISGYGLFYGE